MSFQDLKKKQFISTCSTILLGNSRKTKYHGDVSRLKVPELYVAHAASVDIHNHVRTGSMGLEDVILTKSPEILGFLFTNSYLACKYFKQNQSNLEHIAFKIALANQLLEFKMMLPSIPVMDRENLVSTLDNETSVVVNIHTPVKLPYSTPYYYCWHGYSKSERKTTTFKCSFCNIPLHKSSYDKRKCWELHIIHEVPTKRKIILEITRMRLWTKY